MPTFNKYKELHNEVDVWELRVSKFEQRKAKHWRLSVTWWLIKMVWFPPKKRLP